MIAYDTDVLVELLKGHPTYAAKARAMPKEEQFVPIVVVEEIQRGRLNSIRQAEAGRGSISLERAYELYEQTVTVHVAVHGLVARQVPQQNGNTTRHDVAKQRRKSCFKNIATCPDFPGCR